VLKSHFYPLRIFNCVRTILHYHFVHVGKSSVVFSRMSDYEKFYILDHLHGLGLLGSDTKIQYVTRALITTDMNSSLNTMRYLNHMEHQQYIKETYFYMGIIS
jgi:hypothetical protein